MFFALHYMYKSIVGIFGNMITQKFGVNWENIEEIKPDDWDMKMLHDIKNNPECYEFVPEEDAMKALRTVH